MCENRNMKYTTWIKASCLWIVLNLVHHINAEKESSCDSNSRFINSNQTVNVTELCTVIPCITKCCPKNQIYIYHEVNETISCFDSNNIIDEESLNDYSEVPIYNVNVKQQAIKTKKSIENFTIIYSDDFQIQLNCSVEAIDIEQLFSPPEHVIYILENGILKVRKLNYFNQWTSELLPGQFCIEHQVNLNADGSVSKPRLTIRVYVDDVDDEEEERNLNLTYGLLVSCVFLVLVLAVYALLPKLRNPAGLMLMAFLTTLLSAFVMRAVQVFSTEYGELDKTICIWLNFMLHYTVVASFTWMNVMSFDIWWATRGFRKIHRRGVLVKLGWYGLYGWGAPLLPVFFMVVVENLDLTHMPDFVTPHYSDPNTCFMEEDERRLYMNGPICIILCVNILLFTMTAYNIWRIKHGVTQHSAGESRKNKRDDNRFTLYLKLAFIMGINWSLEIVSSVYDVDSEWWYIPDFFNALTGLTIFIIFVCKRNTILLLCKRLSIGHELVRRWEPTDSKSQGSSRVNSKRRILDSVTDTSELDDVSKSLFNP